MSCTLDSQVATGPQQWPFVIHPQPAPRHTKQRPQRPSTTECPWDVVLANLWPTFDDPTKQQVGRSLLMACKATAAAVVQASRVLVRVDATRDAADILRLLRLLKGLEGPRPTVAAMLCCSAGSGLVDPWHAWQLPRRRVRAVTLTDMDLSASQLTGWLNTLPGVCYVVAVRCTLRASPTRAVALHVRCLHLLAARPAAQATGKPAVAGCRAQPHEDEDDGRQAWRAALPWAAPASPQRRSAVTAPQPAAQPVARVA